VTSYSIITSVFQSEIMRYVGYIEISVGLGIAVGPTIGSVVFTYSDYERTMYFFGLINLAGLLACIALLPKSMNETSEIESQVNEEKILDKQTQKQKEIGILTILNNKDCAFAVLLLCMGFFDITFFAGFLSIEFVNHGLNPDYVGYVIGF
jgi:MFS family permease